MKTHVMKQMITLCMVFCSLGCSQNDKSSRNVTLMDFTLSEQDKKEIMDLAENIPLILSEEGYGAYEQHFHPDYTNWYMTNDKVSDRADFLARVKQWHDAGNRATKSTIVPIAFIPVDASTVLFLNAQQEVFHNETSQNEANLRDMRFISIYKKVEGHWQLFHTGFINNPNYN